LYVSSGVELVAAVSIGDFTTSVSLFCPKDESEIRIARMRISFFIVLILVIVVG
jgi:hypothetical protein